MNPAEYDTIVTEIHGMREIRHAADFVNTMTEDGYVMSHCAQEKDKGWVVGGITAKENADRYQKDISAVTLWGQIPSRVDFQWFTTAELLRRSLAEFADDPKNIEEYGRYLADAKTRSAYMIKEPDSTMWEKPPRFGRSPMRFSTGPQTGRMSLRISAWTTYATRTEKRG